MAYVSSKSTIKPNRPFRQPWSLVAWSIIDWTPTIDRLERAYSENTLRSCRADFALFDDGCKQARRASLPASPETVAAASPIRSIGSSTTQQRPRGLANTATHAGRVNVRSRGDGAGLFPIMHASGWESMNVIGRCVEHA